VLLSVRVGFSSCFRCLIAARARVCVFVCVCKFFCTRIHALVVNFGTSTAKSGSLRARVCVYITSLCLTTMYVNTTACIMYNTTKTTTTTTTTTLTHTRANECAHTSCNYHRGGGRPVNNNNAPRSTSTTVWTRRRPPRREENPARNIMLYRVCVYILKPRRAAFFFAINAMKNINDLCAMRIGAVLCRGLRINISEALTCVRAFKQRVLQYDTASITVVNNPIHLKIVLSTNLNIFKPKLIILLM